MRSILATLVVGALFAIGYVLVNGVGDDFELFDSGIVLSGGTWIAAALAVLGGSLVAAGSVDQVVTEDAEGNAQVQRKYSPIGVAVSVALFGLAGFLLLQGSSSKFVVDITVGECFDDPLKFEVASIVVIPCAEPHDNEVYEVTSLLYGPDAPYPGEEAIFGEGDLICYDAFEGYVGRPYEESTLDVVYFYPTEESWGQGDREVACALYRLDLAKMTGSMRGSGQ